MKNKNNTFKVIQFEKDGKTLFFTGRYRLTFNKGYKKIFAKSIDKIPPSGRFYLKYFEVYKETNWFNTNFFDIDSVLYFEFKRHEKLEGYKNIKVISVKEISGKVIVAL